MNKIDSFINDLRNEKVNSNVFNMYKDEYKCSNLFNYFEKMIKVNPKILLVGEAPGYNGCRLTGIPFTSEFILKNHSFFKKGFQVKGNQKENSATIMWNVLDEINKFPLIWNVFPFHPFKNNEKSNRKPSKEEINQGEYFLKSLINLFDINKIIAVGNTAQITLNNLGYDNVKIRHPSYGGKAEFKKKLIKILKWNLI